MIGSIQDAIAKGSQFKQKGQLEKASQAYQRGLNIDPQSVELLKLYAQSLKDLEYFSLATKTSAKLVEKHPKNVQFINFHAINLRNSGNAEEALKYHKQAIKIDKNNAQYFYQEAKDYDELGDLQKSAKSLEIAINIEGNNSIYLKYKLKLDEKLGKDGRKTLQNLMKIDINSKKQYYIKKTEKEPTNTQYHEELSKCYYTVNQYQNCISEIQKNIELEPENLYHKQIMGVHLMNMNRTQQAAKYLQLLLEAEPNNYFYLQKYASNLYKQKKYQQADKYFQTSLKANPAYYQTYKFYANSLKQQGKFLKAQQIFERGIKHNSDDSRFWRVYGAFLQERQRLGEAEKYYKKALQISPESIDVQFLYANILYRREKLPEAQKQFRKVINLKSTHQEKYLPSFAKLLFLLNKKEEAQRFYLKGTNLYGDWNSFYMYGLFLIHQERYQQAEEQLKMSLQKCPKDQIYQKHLSHASYGRALIKMKRYEEAQDHFKQAIKLNAENEYAHIFYGKLLTKLNRNDEAEQQYLKAIKQEKDLRYPINLSMISQFYLKIERYEDAVKYLKILSMMFQQKSSSQIMRQYFYTEKQIKHMQYVLHQLLPLYDQIERIKNCQQLKDDESKKPDTQNMKNDFFAILKSSLKNEEKDDSHQNTVSKEKFNQLSAIVEQQNKMINKIYERVFYAEDLTAILEQLKNQKNLSAYHYGQNLSWILCSTITSYRAIQIGTVQGGGNIVATENLGFLGKVKSMFGITAHFPGLTTVSNIVSSMLGYIAKQGETSAIKKVVTTTNELFPEQKLSRAVCETVVFLLKDQEHIKILQTKQKNVWYNQIMKKLGDKKEEIIMKIAAIKNIQNDDVQAMADCSFILSEFLKTQQISQNPFLNSAKILLKEKTKAIGSNSESSEPPPSSVSQRSSYVPNKGGSSSYGQKSKNCVCQIM